MKLTGKSHTILFDEASKGGIAEMSAFDGSIRLCGDESVPRTLFSLSLRTERGVESYTNLDAERFSWEFEKESQVLQIACMGFGSHKILVQAQVRLDSVTGESRWRVQVENGTKYPISAVRFPWIAGYNGLDDRPESDSLVLPIGEGKIFRNPLWALLNEKAQLGINYPGNHSMQFIGVYNEDEKGFYLGVEDTTGLTKLINMHKTPGSQGSLTTGVEFRLAESAGNDFHPEFDVAFTPFEGDWRDLAGIYREWASRQWWCETRIHNRDDIPEWFRKIRPIISIENYNTTGGVKPERQRRTLEELVNWERRYTEALGPSIFFWTGWERGGAWVSPDLFPPIEGDEAFDRAVRETKEMDGRLEAYFSTVLYITQHDETMERIEKEGLPFATMRAGGKRKRFTNWWGPSTRMCLATGWWQSILEKTVVDLTKRAFDMVQLDMFPISAPEPCWDTSHGHPAGNGTWCSEAAKQVISRCRKAGREANPDLVISIEQPCELYIPCIDTYLSRDDWRDLVAPAKRGGYYEIPLFSHVYHEYITTQGYEWAMIVLPSMPGTIAVQFARGKLPTAFEGFGSWDPKWVPPSEEQRINTRERVWRLLKKTTEATRTYANDMIVGGRILRPPRCEFVTAKGTVVLDWNSIAPSIGAFECEDGSLGILSLNAGEQEGTLCVWTDKGFLGARSAIELVRDGGTREDLKIENAFPLKLTMAADELLCIRFR